MALAAAMLSARGSYAGFEVLTATEPNTWTAGTVDLSVAPASLQLSIEGAIPGSFGSTCTRVTSTGSLPAQVRLYLKGADLGGDGLASHVTLRIDEGTGGSADCGDFVRTGTVYNTAGMSDTAKTVAGFSAVAHDYATGAGSWNAAPNDQRSYRFSWQLQDDNAAAGRTLTARFTWEAQSLSL
ncbi:hypothetical protein Pta02_17700 [Planobispora takensis]|uniref:Uncharacterized protein n=1 Tax=Planobispora takensis TaxID=1367882 RepID=A0A8J3SSI8_9ACTN|nr:hypothetical protein Pta02_17700 [Planobispora takensis]